MGADYTSMAIIGVGVNLKKIPKKKTRVKAFEHDFPEDWKVDPKNPSRKLWIEEEYLEFAFDDEQNDYVENMTKLIKLPEGVRIYSGTDGEPTILGIGAETGSSNGGDDCTLTSLDDLNITVFKEQLKAILEPLKMWKEKDFGLYALLYCSY